MSVEGSTPLSHNFIDNNEKAAVAISDVTDYLIYHGNMYVSLNLKFKKAKHFKSENYLLS